MSLRLDFAFRFFAVVCFVLAFADTGWARQQYLPDPQNPNNIINVSPTRDIKHLVFKGNIQVSDSVLRHQLNIRDHHPLDMRTAQLLANKVEVYYRGIGYELAVTTAECGREICAIFIDEGLIDNIYIFGLGWRTTLAVRGGILPGNVFNRAQLNQDLAGWVGRNGIEKVNYEVKKKKADEKRIRGVVLQPKEPETGERENAVVQSLSPGFDIYIYFYRNSEIFRSSFGIAAATLDGITVTSGMSSQVDLFPRDHFSLDGSVGYTRRRSVDPAKTTRLSILNAEVDFSYTVKPPAWKWLELGVFSTTDFLFEQRADLPIDRYTYLQNQSTFDFRFFVMPRSYVSVFGGYDVHRLFDVDLVPTNLFPATKTTLHLPITGGEVNFHFGRAEPDKRLNDYFRVKYISSIPGNGRAFSEVKGTFQQVVRRDSYDLLFRTQGVGLLRDSSFFDEHFIRDVGSHGSFERLIFIKNGGTQSIEYRHKVSGDAFQLGVFNDITVFRDENRQTNEKQVEFANATGPVIYLLIENIFRLQFRYAFGVSSTDIRGHNFQISLNKIY